MLGPGPLCHCVAHMAGLHNQETQVANAIGSTLIDS